MLKLKKLIPRHLIEESFKLEDIDKAIDILSEKCPIALEMFARKEFFYRGSKGRAGDQKDLYRRDNSKEGTTRPEKYRPTKDASNNIVHLMFSKLPSWKDIPKREYSTMFSMDQEPAAEYGRIFYVLPEDDPLIAWGRDGDNYNNYDSSFSKKFKGTIMTIEYLTRLMGHVMETCIPNFEPELVTPDNILQYVGALDAVARSMSEYDFLMKIRPAVLKFLHLTEEHMSHPTYAGRVDGLLHSLAPIHSIGMVAFFDSIFDPKENDIKTAHLSQITKELGTHDHAAEMWTEGAIWMVSSRLANGIFRKLTGKWLDTGIEDPDDGPDDNDGFGDMPPDDGKI
jgi:hypothetical protein